MADGGHPERNWRPAHAAASLPSIDGGLERLDGVRIIVRFTGGAARHAADVLALPPCPPGLLYLVEQARPPDQLSLLEAGVQIQLRGGGGEEEEEETVAVIRPLRRSRLVPPWRSWHGSPDERLQIEIDRIGDWSGLTARYTATRPPGALAGLLRRPRLTPRLFSPGQRRFLADCADLPVQPARLRLVGPVQLERWPAHVWCGLDLVVERWSTAQPGDDPFELLELELSVDPPAAEIRQLGFGALLRRQGLDVPDVAVDPIRDIVRLLTGRGGRRQR